MNEDTRVAVCCYEGDAQRLSLDAYLHHDCPVAVLSPEDSRVDIERSGIDCRFGGKRAYTGQDALDRQREHLKILLTFPESYFLVNDSDSMCLDAKIPDYLYAEPDLVWINQVDDAIRQHQGSFPEGWPHVAFQPPYFLSRRTIERLLAVADDPRCAASPMMPFIDYYMVQLTMVAGLPWRRFMDCLSFGMTYPVRGRALTEAQRGVVMVHSVKDSRVLKQLMEFRRLNASAPPRFIDPPRIGRTI
jgi:hypothetical protein